jgi:hypothetical protein
MRTTVTLDKDVERLLRTSMTRSRRTFKETLNAAVRSGLSIRQSRSTPPAFVVNARPMGMRPGIDPTSFNKLADELELDAALALPRRAKRR